MLIDIRLDVSCKEGIWPSGNAQQEQLGFYFYLSVENLCIFEILFLVLCFFYFFPLTRTGVDFFGCIDCP